MTHTFCGKGKRSFYRYYRCIHAIKNGHDECSGGSLPAGEIERVVIDEVRGLGKDDALLPTTRSTVEVLKKHGFSPVFEESSGGHTWINWRNYLSVFAPQLFR